LYTITGYNGELYGYETVLAARNTEYGPKPNGYDYVWVQNIVPLRFYVGVKGLMEDGSKAPEDDFLARNGLRYGQIYGFTIDMSDKGPTKGMFRDEFHLSEDANNGAKVEGVWMAQNWTWDGQVRNFQHDGSWDYQIPPPMAEDEKEYKDYFWWNAGGDNTTGCKTEHITPDLRHGKTGYIQGSTCGYFGHAYILDVDELLSEYTGADLPTHFPGEYYVYQGERDITKQIELGGKGQYTEGRDATRNWDDPEGEGKVTFEDVDGLEIVMSDDGSMHLIIQEDSNNMLGERMFITSALEHEDDGKELTYYLIAMSGGKENTRMAAGVGIPAGTNCKPGVHEFSGVFDVSGLLHKEDGEYFLKANESGEMKRKSDAMVNINDKNIIINLQAHNMACGIIAALQSDSGGQSLLYRPNIPV
jgi:hypothetical protein